MPPSLLDRVLRRAPALPADDVEGPLPTFLTIGTMKGGTSALHSYLAEHPQVGMSKPKETDFFSRPDHGGHDLAWYRSRFSGSGPQFGESSTNYTKRHLFDGVVDRMQPVLPDVRLIFLARDPIERAVSHFLHNVAKGRISSDEFSTYFDDLDNPALVTSRYALPARAVRRGIRAGTHPGRGVGGPARRPRCSAQAGLHLHRRRPRVHLAQLRRSTGT